MTTEAEGEKIEAPAKIIDKIKKLLALSRSDNANEAAQAAAQAAKLMFEYKLGETDVSDSTDDGSVITELPVGAEGFLASWKFALVTQVARSFFCEAIALRHMNRRKVRIVGRKNDAEIAAHVFDHFVTQVDRLTKEESADIFYVVGRATGSMDTRDYLDHFRRGVASGIADRLRIESLAFARSSEKALVLSRTSKDELRSYLTNKFGESKVVSGSAIGSEAANEMAYARGYEKGVDLQVPGRDGSRTLEGKVSPPPPEPASIFSQFNDYETSTRVCPCGASYTWSGIDEGLATWMKAHESHVPSSKVDAVDTDDGKRAWAPQDEEPEHDDLSRGPGGRSLYNPFGDGS